MNIAILLALMALVGYIAFERYFKAQPAQESSPATVAPASTKQPALRARMSSCERVYNRTQLRGYVENTGNTDISFVTVTALWKDLNGRVIESAVVYVVKDQVLAPGERREFEASADKDRAARCNVELLDWWA